MSRVLPTSASVVLAVVWVLAWTSSSPRLLATEVVLKDDRILKGRLGETAGLNEMPAAAGSEKAQPVLLLDDGLRRTFVPKRQLKEVRPEQSESQEKFLLPQQVMRNGATVKTVGPIIRVTPFDQYGRRMFTMNTMRGPASVVQCITELTPTCAKVEGRTHVWDMRLATSSIPPADLAAILNHLVKTGSIDDRKRVARFYLQSERYEDAGKELEKLLAEHPEDSKLKTELAPTIQTIRQLSRQRLLTELEQRRSAGQHKMVMSYLKAFPAEGSSAETLQTVRQMIRDYDKQSAARQLVLKQFTSLLENLGDKRLREKFAVVAEELEQEISPNTLPRLAAFRESLDDAAIRAENRLALATSGWLLGNGGASSDFPLSLSLIEVRSLLRRYLNTADKMGRDRVFAQLSRSQQAATPDLVTKLLAAMKPPMEPPPASPSVPGFHELEVPGLTDQPPVRYWVQTPPEYDPLRRYPAIVTLNGAGSTPEQQINFWAGDPTKEGTRQGQATRQGYIVIAPAWQTDHQKVYDYTLREHAAVLDVLRDARLRFALDTDRVFLSGHSIGGDAAWDIALGHPDLWAGVIPIVAKADRYCTFYTKNAAALPMYFVAGELDSGRTVPNATEWDDYMNNGYNVTIVHFLGRGHESFSDEILRLFDWMSRFRRNFFPQRFETRTMRPWDNVFWWIELKDLPERSVVLPDQWQSKGMQSVPARSTQAAQTKATCSGNSLHIVTGAHDVTIWLSPELVNFNKRLTISVNARNLSGASQIEAQLSTLLEDVRARGDRQHPFWAKIETPTGRVNR